MNITTTEYRVTWFPDDVPDRHRTVPSAPQALRLAQDHRDEAPMIEARTVTFSDWETVHNPTIGVHLGDPK